MKSEIGSIAHSVKVAFSVSVSAVLWVGFLLIVLVFVRHVRQIYWRHYETASNEIESARLHHEGLCVKMPPSQTPQSIRDPVCRRCAETLEKDASHVAMSLTYEDLGAGFSKSFLAIFLLSLHSPWAFASLIVLVSVAWIALSVVRPVWSFLSPPSLPDYDVKKRQ